MTDIRSQARALLPRCIEDRRWFHHHAELSFQEFETADYIEKALAEIPGLRLSRPTPTSVMAVLKTGRPGRCLAIRADVDALPIQEANKAVEASMKLASKKNPLESRYADLAEKLD